MMRDIESSSGVHEKKKTTDIINSLWERAFGIARDLIQESQDLSNERNKKFFENPDDVLEHEPRWHQWGILTHTQMFEKVYRKEIPRYLERWGVGDVVKRHMSGQVDGMSKEELLSVAILLHDFGKFTERKFKQGEDGVSIVSFKKHEVASGKIIRALKFSEMLKQEFGLTNAHIEYIARCAELHYELGVARERAKESATGYTFAFVRSEIFRDQARQCMERYPDFQLEIGLLFLGDSLAKTDIRIEGDSDETIGSQDVQIRKILEQRGLDPRLMNCVKQLPVNCAVAETYLKTWSERKLGSG